MSSLDLSLRIRVCVLDGQEERRRDSVVGRGSQRAYKSNCPRPREERRNFRCSPLFFSFGKGKWNSEAPLSESWRLLVNELSVDCGHESFAATRAAPVFMSGVTERNAFCWGEQRIETYRPFFFPRDNFRTPVDRNVIAAVLDLKFINHSDHVDTNPSFVFFGREKFYWEILIFGILSLFKW